MLTCHVFKLCLCYWKPISLDCKTSDTGIKRSSKLKKLKWDQKIELVFQAISQKNQTETLGLEKFNPALATSLEKWHE